MVRNAEQSMYDAAVAHVDFRGFHEAFSDIGVKRSQSAHKQKVGQQVYIASHSASAYRKAGRKLRGVKQRALAVSKHSPEALKGLRRNLPSELLHIALKVGADEVTTEGETVVIVLS